VSKLTKGLDLELTLVDETTIRVGLLKPKLASFVAKMALALGQAAAEAQAATSSLTAAGTAAAETAAQAVPVGQAASSQATRRQVTLEDVKP
jgi:hypothetical protein